MAKKEIDEIRHFNRFYTEVLGLLDEHILNSDYSLPEGRILLELARNESLTANQIVNTLKIDKSYLSRILRNFEQKGLIEKVRCAKDGRAIYLSLTLFGLEEFKKLNAKSNDQINRILYALSAEERNKLLHNMREIKAILEKAELLENK
jgi:DNA-binding MarR family transcriptional regulator